MLIFIFIVEEELKRLHKMHSSTYGQVPHNYDKEETNTATVEEVAKDEEPDELFVPNPKFFIPEDIELVKFYISFICPLLLLTSIF